MENIVINIEGLDGNNDNDGKYVLSGITNSLNFDLVKVNVIDGKIDTSSIDYTFRLSNGDKVYYYYFYQEMDFTNQYPPQNYLIINDGDEINLSTDYDKMYQTIRQTYKEHLLQKLSA